jgi:membrane protein implicated in regulation of membrane protease activity
MELLSSLGISSFMNLTTLLFIIGVLMFIIEIFTPSFVAGSVGIGFFCAGLASFFIDSYSWLLFIGICGTAVTMFAIRPVVLKWLDKTGAPTNNDAMIGRVTKAKEMIDFDSGSISLDGVVWQARTLDGSEIAVGTPVEVVKIDSIILYVKPKNN